MVADPRDYEAQDAAEAFDEDNLDPDDTGPDAHEFKTFEELPDVFDATQRLGDATDGRSYDEAEFRDGLVDDEDLEDDPLAAAAGEDAYGDDEAEFADDEIELEFTPDVERLCGAQSSAAHFESRAELSEADLEKLGYRDGGDKED